MNEKLTEDNFVLFCAKYYDNPHCSSTEEFIEDLNRVTYIKKLLTRYAEKATVSNDKILTQEYFDSELRNINELAANEYTHLRDVTVSLGMLITVAFKQECDPMDWFVIGEVVDKTPLWDHLKSTLTAQKEPQWSYGIMPTKREFEKEYDSFLLYHKKWLEEYSKF
jgi:hypothetical protein